jgi:hypothetical protein
MIRTEIVHGLAPHLIDPGILQYVVSLARQLLTVSPTVRDAAG